jgi:hypothetical protein
VFPGVPDFICHFHFLRDIGKDYLEPAYRKLRNCLRRHGASTFLSSLTRDIRQHALLQRTDVSRVARAIAGDQALEPAPLVSALGTYSLALWCLQGKRSGNGYGFPFDRPCQTFSERLLALIDRLPDLLTLLPGEELKGNRLFTRLLRKVIEIGQDPEFESCVEELRWRGRIFDRLRRAMRIAEPDVDIGLNDDGSTEAMGAIRCAVGRFRKSLDTDRNLAADPLTRKMAAQIDKYDVRLFADPIQVDGPSGKITIYPQRTNNILERFFRELRRGHRRKSGNNAMRKTLQSMLADTPLVKNLDNPAYVELLLDGRASLEELFSYLELSHAEKIRPVQEDKTSILPGFRKLIRLPSLPARLVEWLAERRRLAAESN